MIKKTIESWAIHILLWSGLCLDVNPLMAQAPGVPVYPSVLGAEGTGGEEERLRNRVEALRVAGLLLGQAAVKTQMERTAPLQLQLPPAETRPLSPTAIWERARANSLRIGWYYLCGSCSKRHMNFSGGYVIAQGGVAATCHHVLIPKGMKMTEAYIFAADDKGNAYPVTEILAANAETDVAILKTGAILIQPQALNTAVRPGDPTYLFSDPMGNRGYFSQGIVNRFYRIGTGDGVVRMNVGSDWAPGSSGAAILDVCGNIIGHVSTISTLPMEKDGHAGGGNSPAETLMVLHAATRAADVLSLAGPRAGHSNE